MKLICCLVTRRLAGETAETKLPAYIQRHIEKCERCRTEVERYQRLRTMLRDEASVKEPCMLAWEDVRPHINEYPQQMPRLRWSFAPAAAAFILAIMAGGVWMWLHIARQPDAPQKVNEQVVSKPNVQPVQTQPVVKEPSSPAVANYNTDLQPVSANDHRKPDIRRVTVGERKSGNPVKTTQPENIVPTPSNDVIVTNPPDIEPRIEVPDEREMTVIAPEERVIDVVGVNVDVGENNDSYVIQRVNNCSYASYEL